MRKGFTILELIVVIIILGVLVSIGLVQYSKMLEKGRTAEAKAILGHIRTAEIAYYQENFAYTANLNLLGLTGVPFGGCDTFHYFVYSADSDTGLAYADRCAAGGKKPDIPPADVYFLTLSIDGHGSSNPPGYW